MRSSRKTVYFLNAYGVLVIVFLYLPLVSVFFASISKTRYLTFPIRRYATDWYLRAVQSPTVSDLVETSLKIAIIVTVISMLVGFFGALAYARYHWKYRNAFQKISKFQIGKMKCLLKVKRIMLLLMPGFAMKCMSYY